MIMDFADQFRNFKFFDPGELVDRDLKLVVAECIPADPSKKYVPAYSINLCKVDSEKF